MNKHTIILETLRAPKFGHRIITSSSGGISLDDVSKICLQAERGEHPDEYFRISRIGSQNNDFGFRDSEEALTIVGPLVKSARQKKKLSELEKCLSNLWEDVDLIFDEDIDWSAIVSTSDKLNPWVQQVVNECEGGSSIWTKRIVIPVLAIVLMCALFLAFDRLDDDVHSKSNGNGNTIELGIPFFDEPAISEFSKLLIQDCGYTDEEAENAKNHLSDLDESILEKWELGYFTALMRKTAFLELERSTSIDNYSSLDNFVPNESNLDFYCKANLSLDAISAAVFTIQGLKSAKTQPPSVISDAIDKILGNPNDPPVENLSPFFSNSDLNSYDLSEQLGTIKFVGDVFSNALAIWTNDLIIQDQSNDSNLSHQNDYQMISALHLIWFHMQKLEELNSAKDQ